MTYETVTCSLGNCRRQSLELVTFDFESINWFCTDEHQVAGVKWAKDHNLDLSNAKFYVW